jgi:DNA-binding response OmpR family regulator
MDVLIVDDERDLCNIMCLICGRKNFSSSCAFTIRDAMIQIKAQPILLFLDNDLTDGAGLEAIEQLKACSPNTKIAFITASTDLKIRDLAFKRGANYFLAKPFHLQKVREILSVLQKLPLAI